MRLIFTFMMMSVSASIAQPVRVPIDPLPTTPVWWTQLGGDATHATTPRAIGPYLSPPVWTSTGDGSITLSFTPQAGVVADDLHIYAVGYSQQFTHHLAAFNQSTGDLAWATEIPFTILDSWSTPTIDSNNDTIIAATGFAIVALDRFTGDLIWSTPMINPIVNASPCVTGDLAGNNRVFITDYTFGAGSNGSLICINTDPKTPNNPYEPGDIVWTTVLPGDCSGNTPAYHEGIVYVSTADDGSGGSGHVLAFDAASTTPPPPLWDTPNTEPLGFFSAVAYADGFVYASSYNFAGTQRSANTIKLDATTGIVQWSVPTIRTDASPIILPNNRLIVSGGVPTSPTTLFTGSLPAIELIEDQGTNATVLWDSFEATHDDLNDNGTWDQGEPFLSIGGWGHHPIAFISNRKTRLLVGTMTPPTGFDPFSHASDLHTIDLSKHPSDQGFIISTQPDVGTTPALIGNRVFSTSAAGINALSLRRSITQPALIERMRSVVDRHQPISTLTPYP